MQLWESDVYDAKVIGLLIDEPKKLTREQAEQQVEELHEGMLTHVFSSCDATLAKTPWAFDLARDWMANEDPVRRRCGYGLLYELCKKNPRAMDDAYLLKRIDHIEKTIREEEMWVREAMAGALLGIGKRNKEMTTTTLRTARSIGPIDVDYGDDNACEPVDVVKHLTSDHQRKKFK